MPLSYLLDENLRGPLWNIIVRQNALAALPIDVVRVGDADSVTLGTKDPEVLIWAQTHNRVLVSVDRRSMSGHLKDHLVAGRHSPGVMTIKPSAALKEVAEFLVIAAYATDP